MSRSIPQRNAAVLFTALLFLGAMGVQEARGQQSGAQGQQGQSSGAQKQQGTGTQAGAPSSSSKSGTGAQSPVAGVIPLGVTKIEADIVTPGYRASKLIKQDVFNDQNQKIGKIEDLVIAPDGTLSVAVVDVGGFLGIAKHRVAIPVKQFTQMHPKVVLPGANKDALKKLPEFVPA
jgi:sporulation protein YlmC with PRC-barrel domain